MRKTVTLSLLLQALVGCATLLWLLWHFIPAANVLKGIVTSMILLLAGWSVWKNDRQCENKAPDTAKISDLPLLDTDGPIVLVCGEGLDEMFQDRLLRKTAQGWWLRTGEVHQLAENVRNIQRQFPRRTGQLSVMFFCQHDKHQDEAVLRSTLKTLRQQLHQLKSLTGFTLPVVISAEFSGGESPWVIVHGDKPLVCPINDSPQSLGDWQQKEGNVSMVPLLSQTYSFVREFLLDELEKTNRLLPPVSAFAVALRMTTVNPGTNSVWAQWLYRRACLQFAATTGDIAPANPFPDAIFPLLAPFASPTQGGQRICHLVLLMWICAVAAVGISAFNNRNLIQQVSTDLKRWAVIPMNNHAPKADALGALKQNVLLLERWQRQGEPLRYSLGYYPGQRLWLALQQAIDTYVPPPALKPEPQPQIVRLNSMSLFDSGKAALKEGSTKVLINALVGIKAKPGWLIVVSGHTDNTGTVQLNQGLSLQRAEAVRNWMRDTGEVPESCFAVQGHGDSRPVATNDTPDGRALNRRVEIALVPQVDACLLNGSTAISLAEK